MPPKPDSTAGTVVRVWSPASIVAWSAVSLMLTGCAALTNPVVNGVPVHLVPDELLTQPHREQMVTIPLNLLRQPQPDRHRLAHKDVLGVYIHGVLPADVNEQITRDLPVFFPSQVDPLGAGLPPSLGYPITVGEDGYIHLPLIDPILVQDMTVNEARDAITRAYIDKEVVRPGRERVFVSLMSPRQTRVMVIREEEGGFASGGRGDIATSAGKRGTGHVVYLRAYQNDVLSALSLTGGLPGLDAYSEIIVFKGGLGAVPAGDPHLLAGPVPHMDQWRACMAANAGRIIRIPTRVLPNQHVNFGPLDIVLEDGDVVLLEARDKEVFYTGGLLPSTEQVLPRDRDLDVLEAIGFVQGPLVNGAFGGNNLTGVLIADGLGNPSPRQLTVIRRTPNGGQIPIEVDLARALRDPRERILVRHGDILVLQETPSQAIGRWISQRFDIRTQVQLLQRGSATSQATSVVP